MCVLLILHKMQQLQCSMYVCMTLYVDAVATYTQTNSKQTRLVANTIHTQMKE